MKKLSKKHILAKVLLLFAVVPTAFYFSIGSVTAIQMPNRSIQASTSEPAAISQNLFRFDVVSTNNIASIVFEYCKNSPVITILCVSPDPDGFDASGAILSAQTGNTGFSYDGVNSTVNRVVLTRASLAGLAVASSYTFDGIVNMSIPNSTVYVRISTHSSADGSGAFVDDGSVAYSTGQLGFSVGVFVPPYLTFCVGVTVSLNCSVAGNVLTSFGELSDTGTKTATSQFSAATNDFSGYNVYLSGSTLTAGNSVIDPLLVSSASIVGVSQFGLNLRNNTTPTVGANPGGIGSAVPSFAYGSSNVFSFSDGDIIAGTSFSTEFNRFTVSYVVNVSEDQKPGIYATTLTYMAVATF